MKEFFAESDCDVETYIDAFGAPMSARMNKSISLSRANEIVSNCAVLIEKAEIVKFIEGEGAYVAITNFKLHRLPIEQDSANRIIAANALLAEAEKALEKFANYRPRDGASIIEKAINEAYAKEAREEIARLNDKYNNCERLRASDVERLTKEREDLNEAIHDAREAIGAKSEDLCVDIEWLKEGRDDLRAEVERLTKLTSGMEDYAVLQRSVQTDHLALLAEAEAALESCRKYFGWDHIDAVTKPPSRQECGRVIGETLARLREKKGGAG